ncbi:MAG: site-2 protease family protein, partial [Caldisphaeraceae archaeon]|nr:site-2 protease family protein [Caldisphaeraceae archaeon]
MSTSSLFFISLISFIIAWIVIYYVFRRLRMKKVTSYPFLLVIKTGIGMDIIKDKRKATFVSFLGWSFLAISIGLMVYFYYLIIRLFSVRYITGGASGLSGGIVPLIPGITISFDQLVYFLIAIGIAVIAHELSHALVARAEGIPIKDSGFLLFAFIPAAFVEPDESVMKSSSPKSRLKVYSAGVAANLLLGLLFLAIFVMIAPRLLNGIIIT